MQSFESSAGADALSLKMCTERLSVFVGLLWEDVLRSPVAVAVFVMQSWFWCKQILRCCGVSCLFCPYITVSGRIALSRLISPEAHASFRDGLVILLQRVLSPGQEMWRCCGQQAGASSARLEYVSRMLGHPYWHLMKRVSCGVRAELKFSNLSHVCSHYYQRWFVVGASWLDCSRTRQLKFSSCELQDWEHGIKVSDGCRCEELGWMDPWWADQGHGSDPGCHCPSKLGQGPQTVKQHPWKEMLSQTVMKLDGHLKMLKINLACLCASRCRMWLVFALITGCWFL